MDYDTFAEKHFNGNQSAMARTFGVTQGAVQYWKKHGIPPLRQMQIELWLLKTAAGAAATGESPPRKASLPAE